MKTLRILAVFSLLTLGAIPMFASQDPPDTPREVAEQARQRFDEIKQRLDLTPEQVEKVRPVLLQELQRLRALRDKNAGRDQTIRGQLQTAREFRDIQNDAAKSMEKILTKQQMQEYRKIQEETREELRERAKNK